MVSVIIPTLNEEVYLPRLLECLKKQTFQEFEIIVSDASSKDKTRDIAESYGAIVVDGGKPAVGRNNGAKAAKGDILVFIDADVEFDENFLGDAILDFNNKKLDLAIPYFKEVHDSRKIRLFLKQSNLNKKIMQHTRFPDGTGQLSIIRKSAFEKLGGYKEIDIAEDTDLYWRAARKKYRVGTVSAKFYSSTRRLEKKGISFLLILWAIVGFFLLFGFIENKKIQQNILKLYGGWGKHK